MCIVQKSRPSSTLGVISPWVRTPQKCVVGLLRWENQHRLSSIELFSCFDHGFGGMINP